MSNSTDLQSYSTDLPAYSDGSPGGLAPWQQQAPVTPPPSPIRRYLAALLRYKWLLLSSVILAGAGAAVAWRVIRLDYQAQGSLWVNGESGGNAGPITEGALFQRYAWIDVLKSFSVLDPVVVEKRLYLLNEPADADLFRTFRIGEGSQFRPGRYQLGVSADGRTYTLRTAEGLAIETGNVGDAIGTQLGFLWRPPASDLRPDVVVDFTVLRPRDAAVRLRDGLEVTMDQAGTFIQVTHRDADPARAAGVLESVMQRIVDVARDLKRGQLDATNKILGEQLQSVEADLLKAEQDLESFRVQTITLPSDQSAPIAAGLQRTQDPVMNQFFTLRLELEELRQDLRAIMQKCRSDYEYAPPRKA